MADNRKTPPGGDEQEFQFSDENLSSSYQGKPYVEPAETKPSLLRRIFTRRVIIILGLIVAVIIIYIFTKPPVQTERRSSEGPTPPSIANSAPTPSNTFEREMLQTDVLLKQQLDTVSKENSDDETQIDQVQRSILNLNRSISTLQQNMNTLTGTVQDLQQQVSQQQNLMLQQNTRSTRATSSKTRASAPAVASVSYHLKAIVPGRAWIQASNGRMLTVKVGDRIAGYGVVNAIDAEQGFVGTSSGRLIQYGPHDS